MGREILSRLLLTTALSFFFCSLFSQQQRIKGVTIIVHGFSLFGSLDNDWVKYAKDIRGRADSGVSTRSVIYKSNSNGFWEKMEPNQYDYNNGEIILLYDWADLSNDGVFSNDYRGNGALESAADNLFASLLSPPSELGITGNQLLSKPIHMIGHSRGAILLMQVCHRIKRYFKFNTIDQLTILDPHPATTMGDANNDQNGSPNNLPCVYGQATNCDLTPGCLNGSGLYIRIPENVLKLDGYYRQDGQYEGGSINGGIFNVSFGSFDGINFSSPPEYLQMNEPILQNSLGVISAFAGGTHSGVQMWYRGTIDTTISIFEFNFCYSQLIGSWYTGTRGQNGFYHSRLGGGEQPYYLSSTLKASLSEMDAALELRGTPGGVARVFNGNFGYNNMSGWYGKGGAYNSVVGGVISNEYNFYYQMPPLDSQSSLPILKHNYLYFGADNSNNQYQSLRFTFHTGVFTPQNDLLFKFYDENGVVVYQQTINIQDAEVYDKVAVVPIPVGLRGKTGTFSLENLSISTVFLTRFELLTSAAIAMGSNSLKASFNRTTHTNELSWNDFAVDETGYEVERSFDENGPWLSVANLAPNSNAFSELAATPNTVYWYRVKAISTTLAAPYSNIDTDTSCQVPNRPHPINLVTLSNRAAQINWSDNNSFETKYVVFYGFSQNGSYDTAAVLPSNSVSFIHANLPSNTNIFYFVKAIELNYQSKSSDTVSAIFQPPATTQLNRLEYFFNNDPGFGNGSQISLTGLTSANFDHTISVANLPDGLHRLYIRALDVGGKWSNVYSKGFAKFVGTGELNIKKLEYFFDNDPGVGQGFPVTTSATIWPFSFAADLTGLSLGLHRIYVRALDNRGRWSNVWSKTFVNEVGSVGLIDKLQYYFDSIPPIGSPIVLSYNMPRRKIDTTISLNILSLTNGLHTAYIQARDKGGVWSNVYSHSFVKLSGSGADTNLTHIEYFFDTTNLANANIIVIQYPKRKLDTLLNLPIATLSDGLHTLYVRAKDAKGRWSTLFSKIFYKVSSPGGLNTLVQAEYFIDNDPGFGQAMSVSFPQQESATIPFNVDLNGLTEGYHRLYIRAKDKFGRWSNVLDTSFAKVVTENCPGGVFVFLSGRTGSLFQWEVNIGSGWNNITNDSVYQGTSSDTLQLLNPPTNFAGNKYRCKVTNGGLITYGNIYELKIKLSWTGAQDSSWTNTNNWSCFRLPDEFVDVIIPGGRSNYPTIVENAKIKSLDMRPGSTVIVKQGVILEIKGH
jgi:hypothetical protein